MHELYPEEVELIKRIRDLSFGPFANFYVEKRPCEDFPVGKITAIRSEKIERFNKKLSTFKIN